MDTAKINQALRLINKSMSENIMMEKWIQLNSDKLDCNKKRERTNIEKDYDPSGTKYLLPHEFLYLLCNAKDRLEYISKVRNIEVTHTKMIIKDFDDWDRMARPGYRNNASSLTKEKIAPKLVINLLSPTVFENQAPNYQLKKMLDKELDNKRIKCEVSYR